MLFIYCTLSIFEILFSSDFVCTQRDPIKSIYWYSLCRDYDPRLSKCAIELANLYVAQGLLQPALQELYAVLQRASAEAEAAAATSFRGHWECTVPRTAASLLGLKAHVQGVSNRGEAEYFFHLVSVPLVADTVCCGLYLVL